MRESLPFLDKIYVKCDTVGKFPWESDKKFQRFGVLGVCLLYEIKRRLDKIFYFVCVEYALHAFIHVCHISLASMIFSMYSRTFG
jgi:hypothetical protein